LGSPSAASRTTTCSTNNVAGCNGEFGIVLFDAQNNRITGNTALSNRVFDAAQDGVISGNVWVNNTFGTTFRI
jgi:parallel beta-helix repeat protein